MKWQEVLDLTTSPRKPCNYDDKDDDVGQEIGDVDQENDGDVGQENGDVEEDEDDVEEVMVRFICRKRKWSRFERVDDYDFPDHL